MGVPQNGWSIEESPIKMDDLGAPLFQETSKSYLSRFFYTTGLAVGPKYGFSSTFAGHTPIVE